MKIGIAGTGRMGTAMALRLLHQGHDLAVWNRTKENTAVAAEAGAVVVAAPAQLVARSDVVISMLLHAQAMQAVYSGREGLLARGVAGKLFIEMSTVRGVAHRDLAAAAETKGALLLECPVCGTVQPARDGKLIGYAGGTPEAFAAAKPLLEQLCRRVEHVGPIGAGAKMKLAVNLLLTVFWQATAEAFSLTQGTQLEPEKLLDLMAETNIGTSLFKTRGALIAAALEGKPFAPATFDIDTMRKDLREMLDDAGALNLALPVARQTLSCFDTASRAGAGKIDATQYPAWWIRLTQRKARA